MREQAERYAKQYGADICEDCKKKLADGVKGLNKFAILRPRKYAKKFLSMLCPDCKTRMVNKVRGGK